MRAAMDERLMDVPGDGGVRLSVRVLAGPAGAPGLLLHHGLASSSHIWDLMLPRLSRTFRVVAYDARGHGLSGKPSSRYGFDPTVADAAAAIRATGLRRPVVVGHSWGALVALALAARRPRTVSGAVLVDGGVGTLCVVDELGEDEGVPRATQAGRHARGRVPSHAPNVRG